MITHICFSPLLFIGFSDTFFIGIGVAKMIFLHYPIGFLGRWSFARTENKVLFGSNPLTIISIEDGLLHFQILPVTIESICIIFPVFAEVEVLPAITWPCFPCIYAYTYLLRSKSLFHKLYRSINLLDLIDGWETLWQLLHD